MAEGVSRRKLPARMPTRDAQLWPAQVEDGSWWHPTLRMKLHHSAKNFGVRQTCCRSPHPTVASGTLLLAAGEADFRRRARAPNGTKEARPSSYFGFAFIFSSRCRAVAKGSTPHSARSSSVT
jgi:hypothetical protein